MAETTRIGVGWSENPESRAAGAEAASMAVAAGGVERPDLALLFATSRQDPVKLRDGVRSVIGPRARLAGGGAVGIITHDFLGYDGCEVGIVLLASDSIRAEVFLERLEAVAGGGERAAGERLGRRLAAAGLPAESSLLLLYDSIGRAEGGKRLNMATPLIAGMSEHLGAWPAVAGLGMIGDMQLNPCRQWVDDEVVEGAAIALAFTGGVRLDTAVMHGCRPAGRYHEVTRTDGSTVLEIDGRPALEVVDEMLGAGAGLSWDDYSFFVTLGLNKGDPYGDFREEDYANRLCIGVDRDRKGLEMFENDLQPGMQVQLMRRAVDFKYIGERTAALLQRARGRRPLFCFYIDCAGRAAAYCGMDEEEAAEVQKALPAEIPLLGVYSGVEVARVGGDVQALDWTGVLCLFSE